MQNLNVWYLGIDFGTTGLSAVLLNASDGQQYPIYWTTITPTGDRESSFRLPAMAYSGIVARNALAESPSISVVVGSLATKVKNTHTGVLIQNFKPFLKTGIPYYSAQTNKWEPCLHWSAQQSVSLYWICRAVQALLVTLNPAKTVDTSAIAVSAVGLSDEILSAALSQLSGVILGDPVGWGDTYRFNMREAILAVGLVKSPEQIFFIEDAIATVLSWLDQRHQAQLKYQELPSSGLSNQALQPFIYESLQPKSFGKGVLIIDAGASTTEMALVDLPEDVQKLSHTDFITGSFAYGGNALDQDIICQMFLKYDGKALSDLGLSLFNLADRSIDQLEKIDPSGDSGNLTKNKNFQLSDLPKAGEPDLKARYHLQQMLQSSPIGQALLKAARHLKLILQQQEQFVFNIGDQKLICTRTDLQKRVILPFIEKLNRELNALLSRTRLGVQGISQVVCTGGTSGLPEVNEWLQQKFIYATLIQDNYSDGGLKTCSRVAHGLATLPLYPQVLERQEQQYSDYFLFWELLNVFPTQPVSLNEVMQLLERRGINTRACKERVLSFLEGKLPKGLVSGGDDASWFTATSKENKEYQAIGSTPLFSKQLDQLYTPNPEQYRHLRRYLTIILSGTYQKLQDPLILDLGIQYANL